MGWTIVRGVIAGLVVIGVSQLSKTSPRLGALLLTLPLVSLLAFIATWTTTGEIATIARLARETLILVPLGLPFFIPLALADRWRLPFWPAFLAGVLLATSAIAFWFWLGPKQ
jgi:hypothetical protein